MKLQFNNKDEEEPCQMQAPKGQTIKDGESLR